MTIYTLGYSGWHVDDVVNMLKELDAILIDVRMAPRSRNPAFNGTSLARLGDGYAWLREFGNRNYKGGPIEIVDFEAGVTKVVQMTRLRKALLLLCGCPDVNTCHRKIVADRLAKLWSANVVHLSPPPKQENPKQQLLF